VQQPVDLLTRQPNSTTRNARGLVPGWLAIAGLAETAFPTTLGGYRVVLPLFGLVSIASAAAVVLTGQLSLGQDG